MTTQEGTMMAAPAVQDDTYELAKWFTDPEMPDTARAALFGLLVRLAVPVARRYVSDLFRDAQYLIGYVKGEGTWFYGVGEWGTTIGEDEELLHHDHSHAEHLWRIEIRNDKGIWEAEITHIKGGSNEPE